MSADFVKLIQTFAADLNATNPEHQKLAWMMVKWLIIEPSVRAEQAKVSSRPRPASSPPHLVNG